MISMMFNELTLLSSAAVPLILTLQVLSIVAFIGGAAVLGWYAWTVWRRPGGWKATWKAKLWSVLLVISALAVLWIAVIYHLIGFNSNF